MALLEARGLIKIFGKLTALNGADLAVADNEFHGLIGPNGSGKSTLMKCVAGAEIPTAGTVTFGGRDITQASPAERARAGMSLKFQITSVLPALTLYDNILLALQAQTSLPSLVFSRTRGALHDRAMAMLEQFRLVDRAAESASALSHGQQQWLEIAMALAPEPKLLLLDEPTGGMSLEERRVTGELLQPIKKQCSLVIVEHDLDFIRDICDRLTVLTRAACWIAARCGRFNPAPRFRRFISAVPEDKYLDIRDLDAGYGRSQVLFGVTLSVPWRGGVAILGRNGAGKTTLMKAIVGELPLLGGSIMLDSRDVGQLPTEKRIRLGVGYVPQEHAVFARLSVRDNLAVGAMTNRDSRAVNRILEIFPKLGQRMDQVAGTLSGGERKMLAIGRALLSDPRLLLLDEPTEGVWIGVIEEITERLVALAKEIAVVIVEQHLDLALQVASHAYVLDRGRVALVGSAAEVRHDPKLLQYLAP